MVQMICEECGGNIRSIGTTLGTKLGCRHCGAINVTKEDN